jgi:O-antigen/teichoic acid export membrane protein
MKEKIYSILKHSAAYSFGNIALKGMGIITLPIYTQFLAVSEYGILGILDITMTILAEIMALGQANSILFFNATKNYQDKKESIFFTITVFVLAANFLIAGVALALRGLSPALFISTSNFTIYFTFIISISALRALNSIFFNKLRVDERSIFYAVLILIKVISFIGLIFYTVVYLNLSITGIMYAYLFNEIFILVILVPSMLSKMKFRFEKDVCLQALNYGFPLIFSAIGVHILNLSDRFLIRYYINFNAVGLYEFGYKIAGVLQMFLILPFGLATLPSTYKEYGKPGDKRYYSKLMTYLCFIVIWGGLALSLFSGLLIKALGTNKFGGAEIFVPVIIAAYIFSAMRNVASIGMMLTLKTYYIGIITVAAALLNIGLNIVLIPVYGTIAAAYTTLIAFVIFYFVTKKLSDRFYSVNYENMKIIKLFAVGIILFVLSEVIPFGGIIVSSLTKLVFILAFPLIMLSLNFYEEIELKTIKESFRKLKNPLELKNIITNLLTDAKKS